MALLSGCIVTDPPQYEEPTRTPPILDLLNARPVLGDVIVIDRTDNDDANDRVELSIPVRSDDQGEFLKAALWVDVSFGSAFFTDRQTKVPPSTLDDEARSINLSWTVKDLPRKPGCHPLTLLVSHESNWDEFNFMPDPIKAQNDTAVATWWMNLDPQPGDEFTLRDCPSKVEFQR